MLAFGTYPLPNSYAQFTTHTITDETRFQQQLDQIRQDNYAFDDEELTLGVRGLAVPIRNREGRSVATIGLSGPTVRLTAAHIPTFVALLQKTAANISAELGFNG